MNTISAVLMSIPWFAWIAIVAIVSSTVHEIFRKRYQHLERIAMINQGIHPDAPLAKPVAERELC